MTIIILLSHVHRSAHRFLHRLCESSPYSAHCFLHRLCKSSPYSAHRFLHRLCKSSPEVVGAGLVPARIPNFRIGEFYGRAQDPPLRLRGTFLSRRRLEASPPKCAQGGHA